MKNTISISTIIENAVNNREIPYHISLDDASRMFADVKGAFQVNPDIYYSGRVCAQQEGDQVVAFGKKNLNVDELRRVMEQFIGKGSVTIRVKSKILKGELIK